VSHCCSSTATRVVAPCGGRRWSTSRQPAGASSRRICADMAKAGWSPVRLPRSVRAGFGGLLDHLGIQCAILGGLSMGGQIVMEFYRRYPARVRGLVLADTSPEAETPRGRSARYAAANRLLREGMEPHADEVPDKMVAPSTIATRPDVTAHVLDMMRRTSPEGAAAALRGRAERVDDGETLGANRPSVRTHSAPGGVTRLGGAEERAARRRPPARSRMGSPRPSTGPARRTRRVAPSGAPPASAEGRRSGHRCP
jgi:pimeloyl-ACP methyl ester carboxylesterase